MANTKNNAQSSNGQKPDLPKRLFWDWNYDKIDWEKHYLAVIDRVIERGNKEEWNEVVHFYGQNRVNNALKTEIKYLPGKRLKDFVDMYALLEIHSLNELHDACCGKYADLNINMVKILYFSMMI